MKTSAKQPHPRNAPQTKAEILAAAQQAFSERGFAQVGIRDIATMAGVSSPMVLRYFGSKAGLFEAALVDAIRVKGLVEADHHKFGDSLSHLLGSVNRDTRASTLVSLSTADPEAQAIAARVILQHAIEPLAEWLGQPDGDLRAMQVVVVGLGFSLCKRMFPGLLAHDGVEKKLAEWYAKTLQVISDHSEQQPAVKGNGNGTSPSDSVI